MKSKEDIKKYMKKYHKKYYQENKEWLNEKGRENYQKNKEKVIERQREYKKDPEVRERYRGYQRKHYPKSKAKLKEMVRSLRKRIIELEKKLYRKKQKESQINNEDDQLNHYFAGYFEGYGRVRLYKHKTKSKWYSKKEKRMKKSKGESYHLIINIFFEDKKVAELFKEQWGGSIIKELRIKEYRKDLNFESKRKKIYQWIAECNSSIDFLGAIYDFILGKKLRKKIELAMKFRRFQRKNFNMRTESVKRTKEKFYQQLKRLNKNG